MTYRAVMVERTKASYLVDVLGMFKVEGSNPAISRSFLSEKWPNMNNLDFWYAGSPQFESRPSFESFYLVSLS